MVFKNVWVLVLWTKVASALEGLSQFHIVKRYQKFSHCILVMVINQVLVLTTRESESDLGRWGLLLAFACLSESPQV